MENLQGAYEVRKKNCETRACACAHAVAHVHNAVCCWMPPVQAIVPLHRAACTDNNKKLLTSIAAQDLLVKATAVLEQAAVDRWAPRRLCPALSPSRLPAVDCSRANCSADEASKSQALEAFEAARGALSATCSAAQQQLEAARVGGTAAAQKSAAPSGAGDPTLEGLQAKLQRMRQAVQAHPEAVSQWTPEEMFS